jgi:IclR family transcriptional regulator, KDG regulon repressor
MPVQRVRYFWLIYLPSAARKSSTLPISKPFTTNTLVDRALLEEEVEKILRIGYGVSCGEWVSDASGVAAPIFDQRKEIVAVLTISGPTQRFNKEKIDQYVEEVTRFAGQISAELGYRKAKDFVR